MKSKCNWKFQAARLPSQRFPVSSKGLSSPSVPISCHTALSTPKLVSCSLSSLSFLTLTAVQLFSVSRLSQPGANTSICPTRSPIVMLIMPPWSHQQSLPLLMSTKLFKSLLMLGIHLVSYDCYYLAQIWSLKWIPRMVKLWAKLICTTTMRSGHWIEKLQDKQMPPYQSPRSKRSSQYHSKVGLSVAPGDKLEGPI